MLLNFAERHGILPFRVFASVAKQSSFFEAAPKRWIASLRSQ
jgi:hypothetical protein